MEIMSYIKDLELCNFRSFVNQNPEGHQNGNRTANALNGHRIQLSRGVTLIHGDNGTGKTVIIF